MSYSTAESMSTALYTLLSYVLPVEYSALKAIRLAYGSAKVLAYPTNIFYAALLAHLAATMLPSTSVRCIAHCTDSCGGRLEHPLSTA